MQREIAHLPSETFISEPFDVPLGLKFLLRSKEIRIYRVPIAEESKMCSGFPRRFVVSDLEGNPILEGNETSSWCSRVCCEGCHAFEIDFHDADGRTVLSMERSAGCSLCFFCQTPSIAVVSGTQPYGSVTQTTSIPRTRLSLTGLDGKPYLQFVGPSYRQTPFIDGIFKMRCHSVKGSIGRMTLQQFNGMDTYHVHFPSDLDLRMKALSIATAVLLDCIFA